MVLEIPKKNNLSYHWISKKKEIMIINDSGEIKIFNSICPHMGARLIYDFKRKEVICPFHGLKFNSKNCTGNHHKYKKISKTAFSLSSSKLEINTNS